MKQLTDRVFDVLVIGGGLAGASVARDCAMRRLSVLVVEKNEIGMGWTDILTGMLLPDLSLIASDRNYLRQLATEVGVYLGIAPNLMEPLPLLYPIVAKPSFSELNRKRARFSAYDSFRVWKGTHTHTELKTRHIPLLDAALNKEMHRLFAWDEWLIQPARLCVRTLKSAEACGAVIAIGHTVEKTQIHNRRVAGAWVRSKEGVKLIRARSVINAAGSEVRKFYPANSPLHRGTFQGGVTAIWERRLGTYSIVPDPIHAAGEAFLPSGFHHCFGVHKFDLPTSALPAEQVEMAFTRITEKLSPIYPSLQRHRLLELRTAITWQPALTTSKFFHDHAEEHHHGLLSVLPHREIEARLTAEKLVDRLVTFLRHRESSRTHLELLPGCTVDPAIEETATKSEHWNRLGFDSLATARLIHRHGHNAFAILELAQSQPELAAVVCECEQVTAAELVYCRTHEWAQGEKALAQRTGAVRGNCAGARCAAWISLLEIPSEEKKQSPPHTALTFGELAGREYAAFMRGFGV